MANAPSSRNWKAWIDLQPPGPPALHVIGEVETPASNKQPKLRKADPQGFNPAILILDLTIEDTGGIGTQDVQYREARYDEQPVRGGQYTSVTIPWEGEEATSIEVEETH